MKKAIAGLALAAVLALPVTAQALTGDAADWRLRWWNGRNHLVVKSQSRAKDIRVRCETPRWVMTARLSPNEVVWWGVEDSAIRANSSCRTIRRFR